ncbi:TIGR02687 family protein [Carnobacterium iners]|uniref:TIGR02687 family protein n=1 Tax=Carnobacterium iners TaxID=1073423 RepID=A0A1X7MNV7_9LACT|nr:BREX-1 system phosphatase PglZ type A [Carnobacterium iners]SEL23484.1 TIGR02687 family protein [Carnobacterium iners]SMH26304.1 TIGR02687 family protein [Carnobacterium iners]
MAQDIIKKIQTFFHSPLQTGEKRKILYLYDEDEQYDEQLTEWSKETALFELLKVTDHNYFQIHYHIEKVMADKNIVLYYTIKRPNDQENPMLGVLLYSYELKLDQDSQLYAAIGIDSTNEALTDLAKQYQTFFKSKERTTKFKKFFQQMITQNQETMEFCILAVLTKAKQPDWTNSLIELFAESVKGQTMRWSAIEKFGNKDRFWRLINRLFGFNLSASKTGKLSIETLMEQLFITHLASEWPEEFPKAFEPFVLPKVNQAIIFINQWMNLRDQQLSYIQVADQLEKELGINQLFNQESLANVTEVQTFQWFDNYLIQQLASQLANGGIDYDYYDQLIAQRRGKFWYKDYRTAYHALRWSLKLVKAVDEMTSLLAKIHDKHLFWQMYQTNFYKIDQAYRKFYFYSDQLIHLNDSFEDLTLTVERHYHQLFLKEFAAKWDQLVMQEARLSRKDITQQTHFYSDEVASFVEQDKKVIVIISDGLRFEAGQELFQRLLEDKRFTGDLSSMQTALPSSTALGMAALLPHQQLAIESTGEVRVNGLSTESIVKRNEVLQKNSSDKALAISYDAVNQLSRDELRSEFSGKKVIYLYHNRIDAIGDQRITENDVFAAVEETLQQLKRLFIRLTTEVSAAQLFVTADHGFLYSRSTIQSTEKVQLITELKGTSYNKRFILSEQENPTQTGLSFSLANQISTNRHVLIPRGINRFSLAGGGYQYVHGGHLPQETMVPLLKIKMVRGRNDIPQVTVNLLSQTRTLTNSVIWLEFLQLDPVSETLKEKRLSVYFEDEIGNKLSNEQVIIADSRNELSQDRIVREKFILSTISYQQSSNYYLVMKNSKDIKDVTKERFKLDIVREIE